MASIPSLTTLNVGDRWTAAKANQLVAALQFLLRQGSGYAPYCQVYNSGNISCADSTATLMTFDSEADDSDAMHSTVSNTGRVTFTTAGLYRVDYYVRFAANATGYRRLNLRLNSGGSGSGGTSLDTDEFASAGSVASTSCAPTSVVRRFSAGDYVEVFATQTSGGALNAVGSASPFNLGVTAQWIGA